MTLRLENLGVLALYILKIVKMHKWRKNAVMAWKLTEEEFELTIRSHKGPIHLHLAFTWENLRIVGGHLMDMGIVLLAVALRPHIIEKVAIQDLVPVPILLACEEGMGEVKMCLKN